MTYVQIFNARWVYGVRAIHYDKIAIWGTVQ
jgi:hypothetical protein